MKGWASPGNAKPSGWPLEAENGSLDDHPLALWERGRGEGNGQAGSFQ